jgi:hypothetical protein
VRSGTTRRRPRLSYGPLSRAARSRSRPVGEQHRAGDDQRVLELLADPLPVGGVREEPLVRLEILFFLDVCGSASAGWRRADASAWRRLLARGLVEARRAV